MAKPTGRPRIELDKEDFEKLCAIHATLEEMTGWFNCSEDTIERWVKRTYNAPFADIVRQKAGNGKISLRRAMWQKALAGNVTLMIWLSKNHLGMTDKLEAKTEVDQQTVTMDMTYMAEWGNKSEASNHGADS